MSRGSKRANVDTMLLYSTPVADGLMAKMKASSPLTVEILVEHALEVLAKQVKGILISAQQYDLVYSVALSDSAGPSGYRTRAAPKV